MSDKIKVALIQQQCLADKAQSLQITLTAIKEAALNGAKLVVLQELHTSHYFCQTESTDNFALAESIPGPTSELLAQTALQYKIVLVSSLFERRAAGIYHNTAVVFEADGSIAGKYRKMHIPDDPSYYEKFYFTPGDLGFKPIKTSVGNLGVLVCWDQWFPEAARLMALQNADFLIYPTAIGWIPEENEAEKQRQLEAWTTIQRAHAIANGIPVLVCNRVGFEPTMPKESNEQESSGIQFWGSSFVAGPQGEILAQTAQQPDILYSELCLQRNDEVRRIWPFFRDRRIDAYAGLLQRYLDD